MHQTTRRMLDTSPTNAIIDRELLARCIDACAECAETCTACADACLGEEGIESLRACIQLNLDCADTCAATARVLTRQLASPRQLIRRYLELCALACRLCGAECEKHRDMHEHCAICADSCRRCEKACQEVLTALGQ